MNPISLDYSDAYKSPLEQVCQERGIEMHSLWQMLTDLKVKCTITKGKDSHIDIDIPDDILCGDYLARGRLAKEIRKYTPKIIKALEEEKSTKLINGNIAVAPTPPSNHLSFTSTTDASETIESITAVIDETGLKRFSKWIKPTGNNSTGVNLNLKLGSPAVTKAELPAISIINSGDITPASFISDLEKVGVSLAYADERLQIDASKLMEAPTGSAVLSSIIEDMKVYMSTNRDEILKYLQSVSALTACFI